MKTKFLLLFFCMYVAVNISAQSRFKWYLFGAQGMDGVTFTDKLTIKKLNGDYWQTSFTIDYWPKLKSYSNFRHTQTVVPIVSVTPPLTLTKNIVSDGTNEYWSFTVDAPKDFNRDIEITIKYNISTRVNLLSPFPTDSYPVSVSGMDEYLSPSFHIESDDAGIAAKAMELRGSETDLYRIIQSLSTWIIANIEPVEVTAGSSARTVFNAKSGDCDGQSNLMAAFLRSLDIPARIIEGWSINYKFPIKLGADFVPSTIYFGGDRTSGTEHIVTHDRRHQAYQVYFPSKNSWVSGDPALKTAFFDWANFIKHYEGNKMTNYQFSYEASGTGNQPVFSLSQEPKVKITTFTTSLGMKEWGTFIPNISQPSDYFLAYSGVGQMTEYNDFYINTKLETLMDNGTKITISPNPASDFLIIETEEASNYNIEIFNATGGKVISKLGDSNETSLDIQSLRSGIYLVKIITPTSISNSKFIKQ